MPGRDLNVEQEGLPVYRSPPSGDVESKDDTSPRSEMKYKGLSQAALEEKVWKLEERCEYVTTSYDKLLVLTEQLLKEIVAVKMKTNQTHRSCNPTYPSRPSVVVPVVAPVPAVPQGKAGTGNPKTLRTKANNIRKSMKLSNPNSPGWSKLCFGLLKVADRRGVNASECCGSLPPERVQSFRATLESKNYVWKKSEPKTEIDWSSVIPKTGKTGDKSVSGKGPDPPT
jgi:hypothetical protein